MQISLFAQRDMWSCTNLWEETFSFYNNPDTLLIIDNMKYPKEAKYIDHFNPLSCRAIVLVYPQNGVWYSACIFLNQKKKKTKRYQTLPTELPMSVYKFPNKIHKGNSVPLFDSCVVAINNKIKHNEYYGKMHSNYTYVYLKIGNETKDVEFYNHSDRGIIDLYDNEGNSIYEIYTLGLNTSTSSSFPVKGKCKSRKIYTPKELRVYSWCEKVMLYFFGK